jgi:nucleotide-binding universal stress UspA family protein
MFHKIAIAYDESPESARALAVAIPLAKTLGAELHSITIMEMLPAYTAYAGAEADLVETLENDRNNFYAQLADKARAAADAEGVALVAHVRDGGEADSVVRFVCEEKIELLVIGIHRRHDRVSRMWSTLFTITQNLPCTCHVLGVH